jgi:hypothetical protein
MFSRFHVFSSLRYIMARWDPPPQPQGVLLMMRCGDAIEMILIMSVVLFTRITVLRYRENQLLWIYFTASEIVASKC